MTSALQANGSDTYKHAYTRVCVLVCVCAFVAWSGSCKLIVFTSSVDVSDLPVQMCDSNTSVKSACSLFVILSKISSPLDHSGRNKGRKWL